MKKISVDLSKNELSSLSEILVEACYGIPLYDFSKKIGAERSKIAEFLTGLRSFEQGDDTKTIEISDEQLVFLRNSFKEVLKEIEEWEFETRLGFDRQEAQRILEKIVAGRVESDTK